MSRAGGRSFGGGRSSRSPSPSRSYQSSRRSPSPQRYRSERRSPSPQRYGRHPRGGYDNYPRGGYDNYHGYITNYRNTIYPIGVIGYYPYGYGYFNQAGFFVALAAGLAAGALLGGY